MDKKSLNSYDRFKYNILALFDIIYEMFEEAKENGVVTTKLGVLNILKICINNTNGEKMIRKFIKRTYLYWDKIKEKDFDYFKELGLNLFKDYEVNRGIDHYKNNDQFSDDVDKSFIGKLSDEHIRSFKTILQSTYADNEGQDIEIFDEERQKDIWNIMHSFVKISLCYIHETRKEVEGKYTVECFPEIKVRENAKLWGIRSIS